MSAQNSAGIQTLLDAEREAQKIVQKAREYRTKRVKEARDEAKKEIDSYKKEKDDELRKYDFEHSSGNKKAEEDANIEVTKKIVEIKELGKKGQETVIQDLLTAVYEVTPIAPDRIKLSR